MDYKQINKSTRLFSGDKSADLSNIVFKSANISSEEASPAHFKLSLLFLIDPVYHFFSNFFPLLFRVFIFKNSLV